MLKRKKNCNVCRALKGNPTLLNRIYNSAFFMKRGESLMAIAKDNATLFKYSNLVNHVKKHQFINNEDFHSRHLRQIANEAEKEVLRRTIESKQVWDEVIEKSMEKLEKGEIPLTANHLLKAAKDKSDFEFREKDQEMAFMQMVYHFASGENNDKESSKYDRRVVAGEAVTYYDPTEESSRSSGAGEERPSGVYYPPAWDAASPGADSIPAGNN